jgi:hypothetical protein
MIRKNSAIRVTCICYLQCIWLTRTSLKTPSNSKLTNKQKHTFVPPPHTFERGVCLFPLAQRLCIWIDYYQCINLTKKAQPTWTQVGPKRLYIYRRRESSLKWSHSFSYGARGYKLDFNCKILVVQLMVFNAIFNNISIISHVAVSFLVEETAVPGENHRPPVSHWQTLSHII